MLHANFTRYALDNWNKLMRNMEDFSRNHGVVILPSPVCAMHPVSGLLLNAKYCFKIATLIKPLRQFNMQSDLNILNQIPTTVLNFIWNICWFKILQFTIANSNSTLNIIFPAKKCCLRGIQTSDLQVSKHARYQLSHTSSPGNMVIGTCYTNNKFWFVIFPFSPPFQLAIAFS
jgi:hypothetical protein